MYNKSEQYCNTCQEYTQQDFNEEHALSTIASGEVTFVKCTECGRRDGAHIDIRMTILANAILRLQSK